MDINNTKVIKDPVRGNGLAASLDFSPGQVLIRITSPFLLVVEKDALDKVCSNCLLEANDENISLKRCSGCKVPRYCSTTCQKTDWKAIHQKECALLKTLPDIPPTAVRGLIHILLSHRYGSKVDPKWAGLESHLDDLKKDKGRWDEIVLQANAGVKFSKSSAEKFEVALHVLSRMACNAFRATLADDTPVGLCFEPIMALANHSCEPNAVVVFDGRIMTLRALNPIKKDEQVFIAYTDPTQPSRNEVLRRQYFFTCDCPKCSAGLNAYETFLKYQPEPRLSDLLYPPKNLTEAARTRIEFLVSNAGKNTIQDTLSRGSQLLQKSKTTAEIRDSAELRTTLSNAIDNKITALPPIPDILHELYTSYLSKSSYFKCLLVLLFLHLHCDVYSYPQPHHPVRVIRLYTIAKLLKHLASLDPAVIIQPTPKNVRQIEVLKQMDFIDAFHAVMILVRDEGERSHGKESRFMDEVERELREVEEVQRLRGGVGTKLRSWQGGGEGAKEAEKVLRGLWILADCMREAISTE